MPQNSAQHVEKGFTADTQLERMLAYNVIDKQNAEIGHVSGLWTEPQGQVAFVGVRASWLIGKTHVFPAQGIEVNHQRETIRVPYNQDIVKNAPTFDPGVELESGDQQEILAYYQQHGLKRPAQQPAEKREDARISLAEEQLKVGKRQVESGGVRLRKIVRTEPVRETVELKREEIEIERVPGQGAPTSKAFQGEDIYIPLCREEAVVQKEAKVREEVRVHKTPRTEQHTVSETVRKEELQTAGTRSAEEQSSRERGT